MGLKSTPIQQRPLIRRVVAVGLYISAMAFLLVISSRDRLGAFFQILLALLIGYWLAAIYTHLLSDRSRLRARMPAIGRKAALWSVIAMSFILGGAFMAVMFLLSYGVGWNLWKDDDG